MRTLSIEKMENVEGGSIWDCIGAGIAFGAVGGMLISAGLGNPLAIAVVASPKGWYAMGSLISGGMIAANGCVND